MDWQHSDDEWLSRADRERELDDLRAEIDSLEREREEAHERGDRHHVFHVDELLDDLYAELEEFQKNPY